LAGPGERMKSSLARLGPIDTLHTAAEEPQVARTAAFSPEQRKRGRQLADQAVVAHGGAAKLKSVTSSEVAGDLNMAVAGRGLTGESRYFRQDPSLLVYT